MSAGNPYDNFGNQPPAAPKSGGAGKTILWILGILGVLGLVCCGGVVAVSWWGMNAASGILGDTAVETFKSNPDVVNELGEIKSSKVNFMATGEESNKKGGGAQVIVVDVEGSKGKGQFIFEMDPNSKDIGKAKLRMSDGREFELASMEPDFQVEPPTSDPAAESDEDSN